VTATLDRLNDLLTLIPYFKKYGSIGPKRLAKRLGVKEKDLHRTLDNILMCGVPPYLPDDYITAVEEEGKITLDFCDHFRRPLRLTAPEAMAVQGVVEGLPEQKTKEGKAAVKSLKDKLANLSGRPGKVEKAEKAEGCAKKGIVSLRPAPAAVGSRILAIEAVIASKIAVKIVYYNFTRDEFTERTVYPLELVEHRDNWYLVAYCTLRSRTRYVPHV